MFKCVCLCVSVFWTWSCTVALFEYCSWNFILKLGLFFSPRRLTAYTTRQNLILWPKRVSGSCWNWCFVGSSACWQRDKHCCEAAFQQVYCRMYWVILNRPVFHKKNNEWGRSAAVQQLQTRHTRPAGPPVFLCILRKTLTAAVDWPNLVASWGNVDFMKLVESSGVLLFANWWNKKWIQEPDFCIFSI